MNSSPSPTPRKACPLILAVGLTAVMGVLPGAAVAASVTGGNLLISVNESTGSTSAPRWLREYTAGGNRVQTLSRVPTPGGTAPSQEDARDLLLGADGGIYLFNGTFDPTVSRFDLANASWAHRPPLDGWSTANSTNNGGIDQLGQLLFLSDQQTFGPGDQPRGIIRLDLTAGTFVRFAQTLSPSDFDIGPSGLLYALDGASSPTSTIYKFDPLTGTTLGTATVPALDYRGITVAADGSFYLTTHAGVVSHFSPSGTLLKSLTVPGEFLGDIDLDFSGRIAVGTLNSGNVVVTDSSLAAFTKFRATDSTAGSTFVAWVPAIPEPSTLLFGVAIGVSCGLERSRRASRT